MGTPSTVTPPRSRPAHAAIVGLVVVLLFALVWEITRPTAPAPLAEGATGTLAQGATRALRGAERLPAALASVVGIVALYILLARTGEARAALYSALVLASFPAWFVHGWTMAGAMVPMACSALVLASAGIAVLDPKAGAKTQAFSLSVAVAAAFVGARFALPNRGLLTVAGPPLAAVGAASVLWGVRPRFGASLLGVSVMLVVASSAYAFRGNDGPVEDFLLGARATVARGSSTFDAPVAAVAYGLVPWSPWVPVALGRRPLHANHLTVLLAGTLSLLAHAALAPRTGAASLVGVAAFAGAIGTLMHSLDSSRRPSVARLATLAVLGSLIAHDIGLSPNRLSIAFGAANAPLVVAAHTSVVVRSVLGAVTALAVCVLIAPRTWLPARRGRCIVVCGAIAGLVLRWHAYAFVLATLSTSPAVHAP